MGGRIARVAHELNVPVSLISGSLENLDNYVGALVRYVRATATCLDGNPGLAQLRADLDLDYVIENAPALLTICREGTHRLNHVVQQLRGYTRAAEAGPRERVDLTAIIEGAIVLAGHGREMIPTVHRDFQDLPRLDGSGASLSQAFVNVIGNAFDAVVTIPDPQVWISARSRGGWVELGIRDNGPGVQAHNRNHIFEAFFTTKSRGSGLGLGLAITKEIVESQGGTIELAESNDMGAEFVIRLPTGEFA
jgi:C4-dicarboxylate-specific signal transduction histidine kinase